MQCHEFAERMQALLDERLPAHTDPRLLAHARLCSDCRLDLRAQELLFKDLRRASSPPLRPGFAERVVSRWEQEHQVHGPKGAGRFWFRGAGALAAIAATALFVVVVVRARPGPDPGVPNRDALVRDAATPPPAADVRPSPAPIAAKSDFQKKVAASSPASAESGSEVESLEGYSQAIQSLASRVPQAVPRLDEVEEATPGLRPVRRSFSLAIGTIRRTIPPTRKPPPPRKPETGDSSYLVAGGDQIV